MHEVYEARSKPGMNTLDTLLDELEEQRDILRNRAAIYGDPTVCFYDASIIVREVFDIHATPKMIAQILAALKMARLKHSPGHVDTQRDLNNYLLISGVL